MPYPTATASSVGMCSDSAAVYKPVFEYTKDYVRRTTIDTELRHTYVKPILPSLRQTANIRLATVRQLAYCAELFPSTFSERFCETIQVSSNNYSLRFNKILNACISILQYFSLNSCWIIINMR